MASSTYWEERLGAGDEFARVVGRREAEGPR